MHPFLLMLEITWLVYFVGVTIASYCISDGSLLARAVRQDVFALGTHITITLATLHGKCNTAWLMLLFAFELFRDVMNGINIQIFTPLRTFNHELWIAVAILVWFQVGLSFVGLSMCGMGMYTHERRK